jgi:hypothetical protein
MSDLFGHNDNVDEVQELYLVCPACRVMSFNLVASVPPVGHAVYNIHCAGCDNVVAEGDEAFKWATKVPETPPAGTVTDLMGYANTVSTGSAHLALARTLKHVENWKKEDTLCLLAGYNTDDQSAFWMNFETEEQRNWVLRKLAEIRSTVENWSNG